MRQLSIEIAAPKTGWITMNITVFSKSNTATVISICNTIILDCKYVYLISTSSLAHVINVNCVDIVVLNRTKNHNGT